MRRALVLCYHAISDRWPADLAVSTKNFERQLRMLIRRGYRGATFSDAVLAPAFEKTIAITFDDGYASVRDRALPILSELGLPATVFVPTTFVGLDGPMSWTGIDQWVGGAFEAELMPMSWDDLRSLVAKGWEIGSHTCTHPHLTRLDDNALRTELRRSRAHCEECIGVECRSVAFPYGDSDERVVRAAAEAQYAAAATLPRRFHTWQPLAWPRVGVYRNDSRLAFRAKISPAVTLLRGTRLWERGIGLRPTGNGRR